MENQESDDKNVFLYSPGNYNKKIRERLEEMLDNEETIIDIEDVVDKKWKFYNKASRFIMLNSDDQLIYTDTTKVLTGNWEFIEHSDMLLLNVNEKDHTNHLIYNVIYALGEMLIIHPHDPQLVQENDHYFEIYYSSRKKPKTDEILALLSQRFHTNEEWQPILWIAAILIIFSFMYFGFIY